jgi:hypothetical protein
MPTPTPTLTLPLRGGGNSCPLSTLGKGLGCGAKPYRRNKKTRKSEFRLREGMEANAETAIITIIEAGGTPVA